MSNNTIISPDEISNLLQKQLFTSSDINKFAGSISDFFWSNCDNFRKENVRFTSHENVDYCSSYACIGDFDIGSRRSLPLVIFHLQPDKIINDRQGKKTQFDIIKKWLKQNNYDSAIAIFVSNKLDSFRISYVYSIYSGAKRTFSHYKRYSFYVNKDLPNKTFIQRLSQYPIDSEKNIIELFSVDKLTKEFYEEIQTWYYEALKHVRFPEDIPIQENPKNATNLIRLLTRLIFCWFIKERGIIPDDLFNPTKLSQILKEFNKDKNSRYYYNAILQNLFFASLNTPVEKRNFTNETNNFNERKKHYGVKNLYRYEEFFNISKDKAIKLFQGVPFLNGGLFDCLDDYDESGKEFCMDGFTRKQEKQAIVPDWLFFHDNPITVDLSEFGLGKKTFRGLIDILKSYNFTTDENSPIDEEVALDPELLGRIFENLLASFNPETASTARKSSGSYYTPREIVDYMVTESLFYYFQTHCPEIAEDKIRLLLSYSDEKIDLSDSEKERLIEAIFKIKVLDPACGSGAFPMGVLHKLVFALQKIDPENQYWKKQILSDVTKKFEQALLNIKTKEEREKIFKELNEVFENNTDDYSRKLFLIENCIYGVDIQNIAIQISKLRFFISLFIEQEIIAITEQDINAKKANYDLKPLPNLETKFVVANTLIGLDKPAQLPLRNLEIEALETKLKDLRHKYFTVQTREEKLRIRKKDKSIREKIAELLIKDGWDDFTARKIAAFAPYDQNASADWFDPEWMFGITDGFDIVIGNPPYVSTKGVSESDKKVLMQQFGFADDLYNHFYFKGIELLKEKGLLTYISSKTFWTIQTKKNLRQLLLKNKLLQLVDTANPFESAMVDTCITMVQKHKANDYEIRFIDISNGWDKKQEYRVKNIVYKNVVNNVFFKPNELNMKIYERIAKNIKLIIEQWWDKISTSKNIEKNKRKLEQYRQSLKPGDITLLGLITEGGVGIQTGNNGKFIGVLEGTKWANKVRQERPQKLWEFIKNFNPKELSILKTKSQVQDYLNNLSENQIRELFDRLKEKYGRDIFGQGWLYRIVRQDEIADVEKLTDDEKLNGIKGKKTFVPYDKGDKDGNRWWAPTPYYIDWSRENVKFLKENSGKKGKGMPVVRNQQFYFREGFCWTDVNSTYLKSRIKENGVYDVLTMSLFTKSNIPDCYYVCMINSKFISEYVDDFVNSTSHFQINDARQLPIIIPTSGQLKEFERIFDRAKKVQEEKFSGKISEKEAEEKLEKIQIELDEKVWELYGLK